MADKKVGLCVCVLDRHEFNQCPNVPTGPDKLCNSCRDASRLIKPEPPRKPLWYERWLKR